MRSYRLLPFPLKVPAYDTYRHWHANADRNPANTWLRARLLETFDGVVAKRKRNG